MRALALRDYPAAVKLLATGEGEAWTPERLTAEMAPYWAAHPELLTTPAARRPDRTRLDPLDAEHFRVQQVLVDGEGDEDWSLDCAVTVDHDGTPQLVLQRIGV